MRAIWFWLFKVSTRAMFALRIKQLWSNAYRSLYEGKYKDVVVMPVDTVDELAARLHPDWWKADGLKQLGDAVSSPQYVQAVWDGTAPKPAAGFDCLPGETLLLKGDFSFCRIDEVKPGDTIMGDGSWVKVKQSWRKGRQELLEFLLNNGSTFRCTPDHRLLVVPKNADGYAGARVDAVEVRASEVRPGDDLLTPERFEEGRERIEPERAWLLGAHIADGWVDCSKIDGRPLGFSLSGQDGCKKEENKERLEAICKREGWHYTWQRKSLNVRSEDAASWLAACGKRAVEKHVPSLNLDRVTVDCLLEGLAADADVRDGVFGTISRQLALQLRVLLRIVGKSAHISRVEDHGGLGDNPIFRVAPRGPTTRKFHARVKAIASAEPDETFDIEVDGHRFYLPEADIIVHNCDEFAIYNTAVLSRSLGIGKILGGLIQENYMSVGWMNGWKPNGHAVCLLTYPKPGGGFEYAFMDYSQPSLRCASIREVCDQVLARYSPGADLVSGVVLTEQLRVVETVSP